KKSGYQPKAYSEALVPLLPETNAKLLAVILDLASSLAAHSEANGISGSKFSRLVGFWLLASNRVGKSETWATFYQRWDETGRMLEHLFLARIRDESSRVTLPRRLAELVANYPYTKTTPSSDDKFLTKPRFSTRTHEALFLRVETESKAPSKESALPHAQVVHTAFAAQ
ncbi:hypothetical protein DL96DRAFT_1434381, partial [Flagelloscypha sp. PMI_526]